MSALFKTLGIHLRGTSGRGCLCPRQHPRLQATVDPDMLSPTHLSSCPDPEIPANLEKTTSAGTTHTALAHTPSLCVTAIRAGSSREPDYSRFLGESLRSTENRGRSRVTHKSGTGRAVIFLPLLLLPDMAVTAASRTEPC